MKLVAESFVLLAASIGCCTLIARFTLTQFFRVAGIDRRQRNSSR